MTDEHQETCDCPECEQEHDPKYQAYLAELALDHELGRKCPRCGERSGFTERKTRTRQYGGGWDTYEHCTKCGYEEIYV